MKIVHEVFVHPWEPSAWQLISCLKAKHSQIDIFILGMETILPWCYGNLTSGPQKKPGAQACSLPLQHPCVLRG